MARLLSERFTVYNYDRRGRSDSGVRRPMPSSARWNLQAILNEAGGSAYVWGLSSGAVLAFADGSGRG
ncbi:hypothetical protein AB4124_01025 [Paenibacillus sp. 2KB_20]|uniref:hypothetical protein n=1 Tax=Paenibacillus sp. 2KB_20 TaxID=3232977 RepID=UPI003F964A7D